MTMTQASHDTTDLLRSIANEHRHTQGGLLPALHAVQDALGYVPSEAVGLLAKALNRSAAEVHGVKTYYHHFRDAPPGRSVVQLCQAEACIACGANELAHQASELLRCEMNTTRTDGEVTLDAVYCLGLCASSPAAQVNGRTYSFMTIKKLKNILSVAGVQS